MNAWKSFNKTDREYLLAPTDDLIRFWRLKVKIAAVCRGQILWTPYFMNYLSNLNATYKE